jgi:hypothetical protein
MRVMEWIKLSGFKQSILPALSLFTSFGTLICCALPALLVSLGMGAVLVGLVSHFPQLIWLSANKFWLFLGAGSVLAVSGALLYHARNLACPIDPLQAQACLRSRVWSIRFYFVSVFIYFLGLFFAYILPLFYFSL